MRGAAGLSLDQHTMSRSPPDGRGLPVLGFGMAPLPRPRFRDWLLRVFPASWARAAEAESREWKTRCRACGHASDVFSLGGLRWGARGRPVIYTRCAGCGGFRRHDLHRVRDGGQSPR